METWLAQTSISFKSNYHDNYKCIHTTLFSNQFGNSENSLLTNLFGGCSCCVETDDLICGAYRLTGFFTVGMTTDRVFRAGYTISSFLSLALSLLDFLRLLLIIFIYLVYLAFFIKCFFGTQGCDFPVSRGLVNFARRDPGVMFTDVASWSLWLFLNIPLFIGNSFIFKDAG